MRRRRFSSPIGYDERGLPAMGRAPEDSVLASDLPVSRADPPGVVAAICPPRAYGLATGYKITYAEYHD